MKRTLVFLTLIGLFLAHPGLQAGMNSDNITPELSLSLHWAAGYDGPGFGDANSSGIVLSPDGETLYATGQSRGLGSDWDYATVAYDAATGEERWSSRYDGPASGKDIPAALAVSPDGLTLFVTGASESLGSQWDEDYATIAYDTATGLERWIARYDYQSDRDAASALAVSPDGSRLFVTGNSRPWRAFGRSDYATLTYDAASGAQLWSERYEGPANGEELAAAVAVSPSGSRVFVAGITRNWGADRWRYATVAYEADTGQQIWIAYHAQDFIYRVSALAVSPDGSKVLVAGNAGTVAYDATTAAQLWSDGASVESMTFDTNGSMVLATGSATLACDAETGGQAWSEAGGHSLALSADGTRMMVSSSGGVAGYDAATGHRFLDARVDAGTSIVTSADGFTLYAMGGATGSDYVTRSYLAVLPVVIDVAPELAGNWVNPSNPAPVPVAILGSAVLDVQDIDVTTLRFGPARVAAAHDLTDLFVYGQHLADVNLDGNIDLIAHFSPQAAGIIEGLDSASLRGRLNSGMPIAGTDSITVLVDASASGQQTLVGPSDR